jgi:hypothetical protein
MYVQARRSTSALAIAALGLFFAFAPTVNAAPKAQVKGKTDQVRSQYVPPKNPAHQPIYDYMKQGGTLELIRELLKPLRLPYILLYKMQDCNGVKNAWYDDEVITVCYDLLADLVKNAPDKDLPIGISRADTIIGPALDLILHETGHAMFHMNGIPVLGREEDAADQFSAYIALKLPKADARRMILGSAYQYRLNVPDEQISLPLSKFSDEHSFPAQRMFNILCIAYGADQKLFADIVEKELLPKNRAEGCPYEYDDLSFAMTRLIDPHIDKSLDRKSREAWMRTITARRAKFEKPR